MSSSVTVSVRSLLITAAVAAALVVAYVIGALQSGEPARAAPGVPVAAAEPAATGSEVPNISMTGTGSATGVPDQLSFGVGVHSTAGDVSTALESANATTRAVLAAVEAQGIDRQDVQTTGLNIDADYDYGDDGPPVITGYSVSQSLSVLVRSLPDAGATIGAVADAGGNAIRVQTIRLQVGDEDALMREARDAAVAEATDKAEQYAAATGQALGEVLVVRETGSARPPTLAYETAALDSALARSVPIRAGTADLEVKVSVVWSFV